MSKVTIIIGSLLVVSIAFNVILVFGKGINITNQYHQEQYQNQQQAQIMMGFFLSKGYLKWRMMTMKEVADLNFKSFEQYLNTLPPEQSLYTKVINDYMLIPEITEKPKEEKK